MGLYLLVMDHVTLHNEIPSVLQLCITLRISSVILLMISTYAVAEPVLHKILLLL